MADESEQPTQILGGPMPPRGGGAATLEPHEPRLGEGGPGGGGPPMPPTGYGGDGDGTGGDGDGDGDRRTAILAAVIGILVVIVLFLLLRPSGNNDDAVVDPTPTVVAATPTPTAEPTATPEATTTATPTPTPAADAPSGGATIDGEGNGGPTLSAGSITKFTVRQGDALAFSVRNDGQATEEVHVHGYDREFDVQPGETRSISFPANITGIFEIEFHGSGEQIGEVTVEP